MVALRDLHRRLHNRDNNNLINREVSPDDYDMDEVEKRNEDKEVSSNLEESNFEIDKEFPEKKKSDFLREDFSGKISNDIDWKETKNKFSKNGFIKNKFKIIGIVILSLLLIIGGIISYVRYKQGSFKPENVFIEFQGDAQVKSGDDMKYRLLIENDNRTNLDDAVLKVIYPEELIPTKMSFTREGTQGAFYIDIGKIKSFETKEFELKFKVFSPNGNQPYLKTELSYQPDNFNSEFVKKDNHLVNIQGSIVDFSLISQKEGANGELLKFIGILTNNTANSFENLVLEMSYPEGFSFDNSGLEILDNENKMFKIPKLEPGEKMEVEILGIFTGQINSVKKMIGKIGFLNEDNNLSEISISEEVVKIIPARITLTQTLVSGGDTENLFTQTGSIVKYKINFKNNSSSPLLDLVLSEKIGGSLVDQDSVNAKNGYYNKEIKEIIWRASDIPELKRLNPGKEGFVEFEYKVKDDFIPENEGNQILTTQAKISSLNIDTNLPESKEINSGNKILKVATDLDLSMSGSFGEGVFKNSGPIPIENGKETTFTIKISLKNNFNEISDPSLLIKLPSGINWKNSFHRTSGDVSFNNRTNELEWRMNQLKSKVGYENQVEELTFQIGIVPQKDKLDKEELTLVNSVNFSGFEEFIDKEISKRLEKFRLNYISDYEF